MAARRRRVVWSQRARDALDEAVAYIAKDAPDVARRLLEGILDAARSLETLSERGRIVPELAEPTFRELLRSPYRLIYRVDAEQVIVVALVHEARDFATWQREQQA